MEVDRHIRSALDASLGMPCILGELADGSLDGEEMTTVASWLLAISDQELSAWVVNRAVRIAERCIPLTSESGSEKRDEQMTSGVMSPQTMRDTAG